MVNQHKVAREGIYAAQKSLTDQGIPAHTIREAMTRVLVEHIARLTPSERKAYVKAIAEKIERSTWVKNGVMRAVKAD